MLKILPGILTVWMFLSATSVFAQEITITASLDTNIILLGDQIKLSLEVKKPESFQLDFPFLADTIIKEVEVLEVFKIDTVSNKAGELVLRQDLLVTSFDSGMYELPPFVFKHNEDTVVFEMLSNPLAIAVLSIPPDTSLQDIHDIKLPYDADITFMEFFLRYWVYFTIGLVVAILVAMVWLFLKKKKKDPTVVKKLRRKEASHIVALRELDKLKNEKLWQQGLVKEYHSKLTEIIRIYTEERFRIKTIEVTSWEILQLAKALPEMKDELYRALEQMLTTADLVKFAKALPLPDENDNSLKNAYMFVEKSIPVVVLEPELIEDTAESANNVDTESSKKDNEDNLNL